MGKKKKTLKQKKLTELHRLKEPHGENLPQITTEQTPQSATFSYSFYQTINKQKTPIYSLQHDLKKTFFVSISILIFLFLFSALLQSHTFMLPLVSLRY